MAIWNGSGGSVKPRAGVWTFINRRSEREIPERMDWRRATSSRNREVDGINLLTRK
jgi:hypothetical protein